MNSEFPRLCEARLAAAHPAVRRPSYDRGAVRIGVVHFGPGAFHRAHQAFYFDEMLARRPDFGVCGVSLRTPDVRQALEPQDGLYTLVEREAELGFRIIGALKEVLTAPDAPEAVFRRLTSPGVRFVTATVTEKGYCLTTAGELDLEHPEVRHDLSGAAAPRTFVGWVVEGLKRRRAAGLPPFVTISCDNLSENGAKLHRAAVRFAEAAGEADLAAWIREEAAFPCSMVDSITPATDDALRTEVTEVLGLADAWPIQRERFVQWVVEDKLGSDAEAFAAAGVTVARQVAPFERAKLRLLNGAHSTLAYVGLMLGRETVSDAMADPALALFVERMMREDVTPTLNAPELDLSAYIGAVLGRFRNPAIVHRLSQIAWDGSQKLRFRLLETAAETLAADRPVDRLAVGVAAWMHFVRRQTAAGAKIIDPLAEKLGEIALECRGEPAADVSGFMALESVFPPTLTADPRFRGAVERAYEALAKEPRSALVA